MRKTANKQLIGMQRAYSRKYSERNNTIPPLMKSKMVKDELTGKMVNNLIRENGNGPKWFKPEHITYPNITTGKCYKSIVDKNGKVVSTRVLSEAGKFQLKTVFKPLVKTSAAYMEAYTQHKFKRWLKKNPCPIKLDGIQQDLFEKEFLKPWEEARDKETERCRNFVISVYDKLSLIGRYKKSSDKYEEIKIAELKDSNLDIFNHSSINDIPKNATLMKKAQRITNVEKKKNSMLVSTNLLDHTQKKGRIILPELSAAA
jgi:hypothetical protein